MKNMHQGFGDWYRAASVIPEGDNLTKRWAGIHQFNPSKESMLELARLFYGVGRPGEKFLQDFRKAFHDTDPAFPAKDNDLELRLLAGAKLVDSWLSYAAPWNHLAALLVLCGSMRGRRKALVSDIVTLAARQTSVQCTNRFNAANLGNAAKFDTKVIEGVKAELAQNISQNLAGPFATLVQEVVRLQKADSELHLQLLLQAEETNMLWWMLGEHGRDAEIHFNALPAPAAPLTIGIDLADLVRVLPGPMAVLAFFNRALGLTEAKPDTLLRLRDCIAAVSVEQRENWTSEARWHDALGDICPIHDGLKLSLLSTKKDAWLPAFQERTDFGKDVSLRAQEMAYQTYLEVLLFKSWQSLT